MVADLVLVKTVRPVFTANMLRRNDLYYHRRRMDGAQACAGGLVVAAREIDKTQEIKTPTRPRFARPPSPEDGEG